MESVMIIELILFWSLIFFPLVLNKAKRTTQKYTDSLYHLNLLYFQRTVYDVLPPVLGNPDYVTDKDYFQTTTGMTHDYKAHGGTLGNMLFKKAPGSWKVHYVEDNIGKVYYQTSLMQKQKGQISEWAFINSEVALQR